MQERLPSKKGGRRESRVPVAPAAACASVESTRVSHYRFTGTPGLPCAMVLTVSSGLSPVTGLVCHRRQQKLFSANLTPASGRQDHTTSPSARLRSRQQRRLRPSHPLPYVRDDRETPLRVGRDGDSCRSDLGEKNTGIFLRAGLDRRIGDLPAGQSCLQRSCWRRAFARRFRTMSRSPSSPALCRQGCHCIYIW